MSADRWSTCPKCKAEGQTLREDYEFYIEVEDAILDIEYGCTCTECGFSFSYRNMIDLLSKNSSEED